MLHKPLKINKNAMETVLNSTVCVGYFRSLSLPYIRNCTLDDGKNTGPKSMAIPTICRYVSTSVTSNQQCTYFPTNDVHC